MQFTFFPYFPSSNFDLEIGRIHLFNFWKYKDKYIEDDAIKVILEKICTMYRKSDLELANNLTVCIWDGDYTFKKLTIEEIDVIHKYALSLLFCSVVKNSEQGCCSSEHFHFKGLEFDYNVESHINYSAGSFFGYSKYVGDMNVKKFVAPEYVEVPIYYNYDEQLFESLIKLINSGDPQEVIIFQALNWVRNSCMNFDHFNNESRAVMIATTFEIFFDLPDHLKAVEFAERLEKCLRTEEMMTKDEEGNDVKGMPSVLKKTVQKKKEKEKEISFSVYGKWAIDFYELRNEIVHEGKITTANWVTSKGKRHIDIALLMMQFCLYRVLAQKGFLIYSSEFRIIGLDANFLKKQKEAELAADIERRL